MLDDDLLSILRCPECGHSPMNRTHRLYAIRCGACSSAFNAVNSKPILIRGSNVVFQPDDYQAHATRLKPENRRLSSWLPTPSVNLSVDRVLRQLATALDERGISKVLVVGGGNQKSWLDAALQRHHMHRIIYTDIDTSADVDVFCDAHDLPFADGSFDGVITTAVLEHVIQPQRVADEIARVLRTGGLIYSELPFMQQVHEGAYDFTRFTLGGHRRLLHCFREIEAGMTAGPATALVWSIENFLLAFTARRGLRKCIKLGSRLLFSPIKFLDYWLARNPGSMDGASCTFFYGEKSESIVTDDDIIRRYVGAKHMSHV